MRAPLQSLHNTSFPPDHPLAPNTPSPPKRRHMAEVLQPLAQQPSMSMLQPHPSPTGSYQQDSSHTYQQSKRQSQAQRSTSHTTIQPHYRATASAPVQPYAFQSTPLLRPDARTTSVTNQAASIGSSASSTTSSAGHHTRNSSKDETSKEKQKDKVSNVINISSSIPDLSLHTFDTPKSSPDRYRRTTSKKTEPTVAQSSHPQALTPQPAVDQAEQSQTAAPSQQPASDDVQPTKATEQAKRYRRRSTATIEPANSSPQLSYSQALQRPASSYSPPVTDSASIQSQGSTLRPTSSHSRRGSDHGSIGETARNTARKDPSPQRAAGRALDAQRRKNNPSPLSRSTLEDGQTDETSTLASPPRSPAKPSPAAQQLAALSDKDLNKGMKSRLRRAFSFGSAAELRKASAPRPVPRNTAVTAARSTARTPEELDEEQQEIIRKQEEAGIGAGIYSGQGGFIGSTDNISVSSTASSASVMLRKMGQGMKKSGRSLKGLFRPKSVIGVPAADGPIEASLAQVSMVTVEAERQRVNVNSSVSDNADGGTGFPKLEQNSMDKLELQTDFSSAERNDSLRKSVVGSDRDRAEVLAAVKKGILKRSATASPTASPTIRAQTPVTITDVPRSESPAGSHPTTPKDERKSRSLSSTNSSSDYFSHRLNINTRSMPTTPQSARNITFSPRIQFHDAWSSTEYDRRGEIATCNRLTPMLAQQIKEELNTFKMEMEVHELSKPHTHFF